LKPALEEFYHECAAKCYSKPISKRGKVIKVYKVNFACKFGGVGHGPQEVKHFKSFEIIF